ncbi:enterochelin esterase [Achromobacter xylosoxidans]|uniref:Enterochelin esterase n=2 Tax=Alcaligenes xylosoxydans xylosoxydans TaxID=85698 RepID=A0A424WKT4_ALCXX|nr:enterochelin esterase [Achromobacter xylosoxidans]MBD0867627.1 enterochelin esterase [Achromobacter xylosoxidans]QNP88944.1 enterochelin esterase [Achromobacter xylosoxidans]RPJ93888.1 enterochelin esterase [Achromobacter xylosoxidans]
MSSAALAVSMIGMAPGMAAAQSRQGVVTPEAHMDERISLRKGEFLAGTWAAESGVTLDLLDSAGQHVRRLSDGEKPAGALMLVAPEDGLYTVRAQGQGLFRWAVTERLPLAEQRASAPAFDSPRLAALAATLAAGGTTDAFWDEVAQRGAPLVEAVDARHDRVTFLWRGAERNVRLFGGPSSDHAQLARLGNSDVWHASFVVPRSTRLSYRLAPDVPELPGSGMARRRAILATAQADPHNPKAYPVRGVDAYQTYSMLELADAPPQPWVEPRADVRQGTVETKELRSDLMRNTRKIHLYRPAGWQPGAADNHVLVLFDAGAYLGRVPTPTILDNMIAAGVIPPTAALLVDNPTAESRSQELPPNPDFADFLAKELMPWARKQGISAPAARTVIGGSSYGGLASAYAALRHPEVFGNVLSQSGSYWWSPAGEEDQWLTRQFVAVRKLPVRFFLGAGLFESGRGGQPGILETNRHLRDVLRAKGYLVTHREVAGGHDYLVWRGTLSDGLLDLIGTGKQRGG